MWGTFGLLNLYEDFAVPDFAVPDFGFFSFSPAGAVLETHVPSMPAANDFPELHQPFAERKAEMRAAVLDGVDSFIPAE